MSKHTPGPWETQYRKVGDSMYRTEIFSEQHGGIASCSWTPKHCGNGVIETYREANARLIAAAPELLEALRHIEGVAMADEPRDLPGIVQTARAAIAKATGELFNTGNEGREASHSIDKLG